MAFFLESTFIGLFFFGWDRLSKGKHLAATILMAVAPTSPPSGFSLPTPG